MRVSFRIYSRRPLGPLCRTVVDVLDSNGILLDRKLYLFSRSDRSDLGDEEIFQSAGSSANDRLTIESASGSLTMGWLRGPKAHTFSQSILGHLSISSTAEKRFPAFFFDLCRSVDAFFGACDTQESFRRDLDLWSRAGDITKYLIRPYWLNYLGAEYIDQVPVSQLQELGVLFHSVHPSSAIEIPGVGTQEGISTDAAITAAWPVFLTSKPAGKFATPVFVKLIEEGGFDESSTRVGSVESLIGDVAAFINSVSARRQRGEEWARNHNFSLEDPRDVLLAARKFEALVRDDRQLFLDLLATYGDLIRERTRGRWSVGRALYRGEPVVKSGALRLLVQPIVRDFVEALSAS